jgi:hypothetical protein
MVKIDRRRFTQEAGLAFLAGVSVTVSGCGGGGGTGMNSGDDYGPPTSSTPPQTASGNKSGSIASNHGHEAVITAAELAAGGDVRVNIAGTAGHNHVVDLPAQAVREIRDGQAVQKESSSTDGHVHVVTFNADLDDTPSRY